MPCFLPLFNRLDFNTVGQSSIKERLSKLMEPNTLKRDLKGVEYGDRVREEGSKGMMSCSQPNGRTDMRADSEHSLKIGKGKFNLKRIIREKKEK